MDAERWEFIKGVFNAALELPPAERAAYLAHACGGDAELRRQVEDLIAAHEEAETFIEDSPAAHKSELWRAVGAWVKDEDATFVGRRVGAYRLVREIGHGGMGAVYLAVRDDAFRKRVAVKLVKRGMDTAEVLRRFRHERQILAALEHPNIARLIDGGTTDDGLPYLVMEYVEGEPIDRYCEGHKLPVAERLKLFAEVCAAVHYAHQNLVVHRDLKPSNILVTKEGTPKLLDFGIAKLLNPEMAGLTFNPTGEGGRLMTPEYASPEQMRGEQITTASDIYSLGVILYELLTGERPYRLDRRAPHEILKIVCEQEPERPSTAASRAVRTAGAAAPTKTRSRDAGARTEAPEKLRRMLRGDLDNIVLMALRKDPRRRYLSANQLAADLRRYLDGRPVTARHDTFAYRAEKFIRRNRAGVTAAALIALTLSGGLATTAWQARTARRERARAEQRFNEVRSLATHFILDLNRDIARLPGSTVAQEKLVKKALEIYDNLAREADDDVSLQLDLADAYYNVAEIQWRRYHGHLGQLDQASVSSRKALEIYRRLAADPVSEVRERARYGLAWAGVQTGDLLIGAGKTREALDAYRQALDTAKDLAQTKPTKNNRHVLMIAYQRMGDTLGNPGYPNVGDKEGALAHYQQMLSLDEQAAAEEPQNPERQYDLRISYEKLRDVRWALGDRAGAFEIYRRAQEINERLVAAYPNDAFYKRDLAIVYGKMGAMFAETGETARAWEQYRRSLEIREALAAEGKNAAARADLEVLAWPLLSLAVKMHRQNPAGEAREPAQRGLALLKAKAERAEATGADLADYAFALALLPFDEWRDPPRAIELLRRATQLSKEDMPYFYDTLALAHFVAGEYAPAVEAAARARRALAERKRRGTDDGAVSEQQCEADLMLAEAGQAFKAGDGQRGAELMRRAAALLANDEWRAWLLARSPAGRSDWR
jgi:eukaryotic-like serine/threonine-protein kinase